MICSRFSLLLLLFLSLLLSSQKAEQLSYPPWNSLLFWFLGVFHQFIKSTLLFITLSPSPPFNSTYTSTNISPKICDQSFALIATTLWSNFLYLIPNSYFKFHLDILYRKINVDRLLIVHSLTVSLVKKNTLSQIVFN